MKTRIITLLLLGSILFLSSCNNCGRGSRSLDSKTFNETDFTQLEAGGAFDVTVKEGNSYSIKVTTQERILDNVKIDKDGSTLKMKLDKWHCNCDVPIEVEITMPNVSSIEASGGSHFELVDFDGTNLNLHSSGGAGIDAENIGFTSVTIHSSGGSKTDLNGSTNQLTVDMSGGSQNYLYDLNAVNVDVDGSGGSKAEIRASNTLDVDLSGGSKVEYKGTPSVNANTSGGASIENRN